MNKLILCLLVIMLVCAGCMSAEQKAEVDTLADRATTLQEQITNAKARMEAGTLSTEEGVLLIAGWTAEIVGIYNKMSEITKEGVSWWEVVGMCALTFFSRGISSKGPLVPVFNLVSGLFGAKQKK